METQCEKVGYVVGITLFTTKVDLQYAKEGESLPSAVSAKCVRPNEMSSKNTTSPVKVPL